MRAAGMPLILGIWGGKGCGKTFSVGFVAVTWASRPSWCPRASWRTPWRAASAALRRAYVAAADEAARQGTPTVLVVNDLDAGVARFRDDKVTVNNQIVQASLMNLCDTPTAVALGDPKRADRRAWDSREERVVANEGDERADARKRFGSVKCRRVPIVVTGNDFSRLYAPLTRSGRMDLWHWEPSRSEIAAMLHATLAPAAGEDAGTFGYGGEQDARAGGAVPGPAAGLFAAARAACADDAVRAWVKDGGSKREKRNVSVSITARRRNKTSRCPRCSARRRAAREQQNVLDANLAREYVNAWTDRLKPRPRSARAGAPTPRARARQRRGTSSTRTPRSAPSGSARRAQTRKRGRATRRATRRAPPPRLCRRRPPRAARLGLASPVSVGVRVTKQKRRSRATSRRDRRPRRRDRGRRGTACGVTARARRTRARRSSWTSARGKRSSARP